MADLQPLTASGTRRCQALIKSHRFGAPATQCTLHAFEGDFCCRHAGKTVSPSPDAAAFAALREENLTLRAVLTRAVAAGLPEPVERAARRALNGGTTSTTDAATVTSGNLMDRNHRHERA